jgi:hypothetical protein
VGAVGADTAAAEPGGHEATAAADHAAAAEVTEENGVEADGDEARCSSTRTKPTSTTSRR